MGTDLLPNVDCFFINLASVSPYQKVDFESQRSAVQKR
jgi:hypothetical protein